MPDPKQLKSGDPVSKNWREINAVNLKLADALRQLSRVRDVAAQLETDRGIWKKGGSVTRVKVLAFFDDVLLCETVGYVAKPFRLTKTPFHGKTINFTDERGRTYAVTYNYWSAHLRTVSIPNVAGVAVVENQVVIPRYVPDLDHIYVTTAPDTGVTDPEGKTVKHIDINADARAWARER